MGYNFKYEKNGKNCQDMREPSESEFDEVRSQVARARTVFDQNFSRYTCSDFLAPFWDGQWFHSSKHNLLFRDDEEQVSEVLIPLNDANRTNAFLGVEVVGDSYRITRYKVVENPDKDDDVNESLESDWQIVTESLY